MCTTNYYGELISTHNIFCSERPVLLTMDSLMSQLRFVIEEDRTFIGTNFLANYAKIVFGQKRDNVTRKEATSLAKEIRVFINAVRKKQKESGVTLISLGPIEYKILQYISTSFELNSKVIDGDIAMEKFVASIQSDETFKDPNNMKVVLSYAHSEELSAALVSEIQVNFSGKKAMYNALGQYEVLKSFINTDYKTCISWDDFVNKMSAILKTALLEVQTYEHDAVNSLDLSSVNVSDVKTNNDNSRKISTGYKMFDSLLTGGFQPQRVYMFGGISGGGKSLTLINFAFRAKIFLDYTYRKSRNKHAILYLSLENSVEETRDRFVCCSLAKSIPQIDKMVMSGESYDYNEAYKKIFSPDNVSIHIVYRPAKSINVFDVQTIISDIERNTGRKVDICFIDYADKMSAVHSSKADQEWRDLGYIIDELKATSIELNVPVVTVTQLNRDAYNKGGNNGFNNSGSTGAHKGPSGGGIIAGSVRKRENVDFFAIFNFKTSEKREIEPSMLVENDEVGNQRVFNSNVEQVWCTIDKNRSGPDNVSFPVYIDYSTYRMLNTQNEKMSYKQYGVELSSEGFDNRIMGFDVEEF